MERKGKNRFRLVRSAISSKINSKTSELDTQALIPRITNDNLDAHRKEVLGKAKKLIYPLSHSKHKVVMISGAISFAALCIFTAYSFLALYRFKYDSNFYYRLTKAIPYPVAKIGNNFVEYRDYLFELNQYTYYYQTQIGSDFTTEDGKKQLLEAKKNSLAKAIDQEYVRILAKENKVEVTEAELATEIEFIKKNVASSGGRGYEDSLKNFYNWTVKDLEKSLRTQLLAQKVVKALDTESVKKVDEIKKQLSAGQSFEVLIETMSDDASKANKGVYGDVGRDSHELPQKVVDSLFSLPIGTVSPAIDIGYATIFIKPVEQVGDKIKMSQLVVNHKNINEYINHKKEQQGFKQFVSF